MTLMNGVVDGLRILHVVAGFAALLVAPVAILTAKGSRAHRRWGKLYYREMLVVAVSALVLTAFRPNPFLAILAVLSFYMAFSGYRVLGRKRLDASRVDVVAWAMAVATLGASMALVVLGLLAPTEAWQRVAIVAVVLGVVGIALSGREIAELARPSPERMTWWFAHMTRMLGSYIATVTAFSVVNFTFLPPTARWLWPTLVGTPLIALWVGAYRRRFRRPAVAAVPRLEEVAS